MLKRTSKRPGRSWRSKGDSAPLLRGADDRRQLTAVDGAPAQATRRPLKLRSSVYAQNGRYHLNHKRLVANGQRVLDYLRNVEGPVEQAERDGKSAADRIF